MPVKSLPTFVCVCVCVGGGGGGGGGRGFSIGKMDKIQVIQLKRIFFNVFPIHT